MASGGGFGALDTMNKTLKNNRALLKKINVFERVKNYNSSLKGRKVSIPNKKASEEQLQEIKVRTLREDKRQTMKQVTKIAVVFLVIIALLALIITGVLNR
ncbi:MAG: hypothetical protein KDC79_00495 [Cyclobacteriaceae bacterium]|nr:hypothetical protein [Cyclobacteriaceae bacterium]